MIPKFSNMLQKKEGELFTPSQLSKECSYTPQEIGTLVRLGLVTGRKIGRTTLVDKDSFMKLLEFRGHVKGLSIIWN